MILSLLWLKIFDFLYLEQSYANSIDLLLFKYNSIISNYYRVMIVIQIKYFELSWSWDEYLWPYDLEHFHYWSNIDIPNSNILLSIISIDEICIHILSKIIGLYKFDYNFMRSFTTFRITKRRHTELAKYLVMIEYAKYFVIKHFLVL